MATYLDILLLKGGFYIFQIKDKAKRFPVENFPAQQMSVPYFSSCVAEIPTPIGPHGPTRRNYPEYISLQF